MVHAELTNLGDRATFDEWYREHLTQASEIFTARSAWRCWSEAKPSDHYAFYEFADVATIGTVLRSSGFRSLAAEFDRRWGCRVQRSREILDVVQEQPKPSSE